MTMATSQIKMQEQTLFDQLRAGFGHVVRQARHVDIRFDRLESYAESLPDQPPKNVFDSKNHFSGDDEATASYVVTLDSINFGSGYKPSLEAEGWAMVEGSLYFTVARNLKKFYEKKGALDAVSLAAMTAEDVSKILKLDLERPHSSAFASLCAENMRETGVFMQKNHGGRFVNLIESSGSSAENLIADLIRMRQFNDVHLYKGANIAFYKRAQITAADLYLAFRHKGRELFSDIGNLTIFADDALPHILRMDGVLSYEPELARRIDSGWLIPSGSEEEIEIRASAAHAVELIAGYKKMKAMDIDHILWHACTESPLYRRKPAHRTFTRFY